MWCDSLILMSRGTVFRPSITHPPMPTAAVEEFSWKPDGNRRVCWSWMTESLAKSTIISHSTVFQCPYIKALVYTIEMGSSFYRNYPVLHLGLFECLWLWRVNAGANLSFQHSARTQKHFPLEEKYVAFTINQVDHRKHNSTFKKNTKKQSFF